ncbi:MAG: AAA family ATPase, partial [Methanophagales archaeon]|nr:AAA family ATPase [Methanophagales archaeon]
MSIKRIEVKNFKSFKELKIDLGKFNVIIGANASGKSNFVHIFEFLRDITSSGLDNAVSMQGGREYLRNMNIGASEPLSIKVVSDQEFRWGLETKVGLIGVKTYEATYEFALRFNKRGSIFRIVKDELSQKCKFLKLERKGKKIEEKEILGDGEILISRSNGRVKIDLNIPPNVPLKKEDIFPPFLQEEKLPEHKLLLETPYFFIPPLEGIFSEISIYDFDPKLPKKATPITGKAELEEDGINLPIILKNITENRERRRKLLNLVKDVLPFEIGKSTRLNS